MSPSPIDDETYCREVESYLCRKNDGHLIRLVGPSFELVREWARQGVPLTIVCRGIDQYVERYYAKGPRRRPVRIEFCEADVLDLFDHWRRATGISLAGAASGAEPAPKPRESLHAHVDRAVSRLETRAADGDLPERLVEVVAEVGRELASWRERAKGLRGAPRQQLLERLAHLDASLLAAARGAVPADRLEGFAQIAAADLEPFRARMEPAAFDRSLHAATDSLLREGCRLPRLTFP